MCLVEIGQKKPDGSVAMQPKLIPGCQTPVTDGMVIVSDSEKVKAAQKATLEYLLLNHPLDCPTCDQAGECFLQDYSYQATAAGTAGCRSRRSSRRTRITSASRSRCSPIAASCARRCVRFTREISGTAELQVIDRGDHSEIDIFPGEPCNNKLAGNVVDLCPVGALCSKDFLYKQRVWWLKTADSVCPNCSTGCSIYVDRERRPRVSAAAARRIRWRRATSCATKAASAGSTCTAIERLTLPEQRQRRQSCVARLGCRAAGGASGARRGRAKRARRAIAAVLSPWMTLEEAYLLASYLKSLVAEGCARDGAGAMRSARTTSIRRTCTAGRWSR